MERRITAAFTRKVADGRHLPRRRPADSTPCAIAAKQVPARYRAHHRHRPFAGAQLALWAPPARVCRKTVPSTCANPLPLRAAVSIGGIPDMRAFAANPGGPCGGRQIRVMGGPPSDHPDRYALFSPAERLPLGVPKVLIWASTRAVAPHALFTEYEAKAKSAGDAVASVIVPGAGIMI